MIAEQKAAEETREAGRKAYEKRMGEWKADKEEREAERKADREIGTRLEAISDKIKAKKTNYARAGRSSTLNKK
jgi:hypothetical protein